MTSPQKFVLILVFFIGGLAFLLRLISGDGEQHSGELRTDIAERRDLMSVVPASGEVLPLLSSIVKSEMVLILWDRSTPVRRRHLQPSTCADGRSSACSQLC